MGQAGTGRARIGRVETGLAKMGQTGRSGTGRLGKKLQRTLLLLTVFSGFSPGGITPPHGEIPPGQNVPKTRTGKLLPTVACVTYDVT
jgi:hypothetical protein